MPHLSFNGAPKVASFILLSSNLNKHEPEKREKIFYPIRDKYCRDRTGGIPKQEA